MAICPNCGKNTPEGKFCEHCGASVATTQTFQQPVAQQPVYTQQPIAVKQDKNAIGAAIASAIWCGLGQTYNGQLGKGLGLFLGFLFFYLLMMTGVGFFALFVLIIWVYGVYDAYTTSTKMNAGQIPYAATNIGSIIGFIIGSFILGIIIGAIIIVVTTFGSY